MALFLHVYHDDVGGNQRDVQYLFPGMVSGGEKKEQEEAEGRIEWCGK